MSLVRSGSEPDQPTQEFEMSQAPVSLASQAAAPFAIASEPQPGTRKALVHEIDDFCADLKTWQDRDYFAHRRWYNAAVFLPIILFIVAAAAAVAGAVAGKGIAAVVGAIVVSLTGLVSRLGCQARANYYARHGNLLVTCTRRARLIKARTVEDPQSVENGFMRLEELFEQTKSLEVELVTGRRGPF
jgi:hypothetical protein